MKHNFFEVLGLANIERIHSQIWLYFFNNDFLDSKQKSCILNTFFNTEGEYQKFKCYTEYKNVDVLIKADDKIFAIENKIKIGQHDEQLQRYYDYLLDDSQRIKPLCVYLSLIGEDPRVENWLPRSYADLLNTLQSIYFKKPSKFEESIFNEYVDSLKRLVDVFNKFSNHHEMFPQVFSDGNKTKHGKGDLMDSGYYENDDQKYIALNQLETIFQKHFLLKIADGMGINLSSDKLPHGHISESNGTAILHIDMIDGYDRNYVFGIQFQGQAVKMTYAKKDYLNSHKVELEEKIAIFKHFALSKQGLKFNRPKTKAYISISKKMGDLNFWKQDFNTLLDIYKKSFTEFSTLINEVRF